MPKSTILVVDDENSVLRALSEILTIENYNVLTAKDGLCAMDIIKENQHEIHLVITNIKMPKLDGFELIQQMSSMLRHPMAVIINSGCCGEVRRDHLKLGTAENILLYDIFQKPPNLLEFFKSIEEAIDITRKRRQALVEKDMAQYLSYN
jgi:DNA-binding NtrC family response regulator